MTTTTTTEAKTRVITLTDAQPVRVREDLWPIIASARDWDGEHESQAFRRWYLTVRQHADGRSIVYGRYTTQWQGEANRVGGERLSASADIPAAIRRVGEHVGVSDAMIDSCVADLPVQDID